MIYLPWIVFVVGILVMFLQGLRARRKYLRFKAERPKTHIDVTARNTQTDGTPTAQDRGQGQTPELAEALGGGQKRSSSNAIGFGASR